MQIRINILNYITLTLLLLAMSSCGASTEPGKMNANSSKANDVATNAFDNVNFQGVTSIMLSPKNPKAGEAFRVMVVGDKSILRSAIKFSSATVHSIGSRSGVGLPFWRIEEFDGLPAGSYHITLQGNKKDAAMEFTVGAKAPSFDGQGVWRTEKGWDAALEELYSAWVNALFCDADERSIWKALHEVTQNRERNFLYNHLSLNEDDPTDKNRVMMQPDCADNPFYLRAYFAWKMGLPFGYHECDRGYLGKAPHTGRWITNENNISGATSVRKFNTFVRMVMNGVHSGTARTALADESSDYYPVSLSAGTLRPGVVYADPYGHTLILVHQIAQTREKPGVLLSVDAQPDGTVGIKRFWKGNFLFSTNEVVGEPGFKAFRPIVVESGKFRLLTSDEINKDPAYLPFSMQQKGLDATLFYDDMDRVINPQPLDPEAALLDLIQALHEQLIVRLTSVANGEAYMKAHPGEVIGMPGSPAGVFQAGGQWEDFSTPNRDLRLLIAMDAILDFPEKIVRRPENYQLPLLKSPEQVKKSLETLLNRKLSELTIAYTRSNGTEQTLTLTEIMARRDAFEMAYNPNDGIEIRWGAPVGSEERSSCKRQVPANQLARMNATRQWFHKRLHPPT